MNDNGAKIIKYLNDSIDNIVSLIVVLCGIWLIFKGLYDKGFTLIGMGLGYVAGKTNPEKRRGE